MRTGERSEAPRAAVRRSTRDPRTTALAVATPLIGPLVIVGSVLVVLRGLAFHGFLPSQHPDLLSTFLPSWCLMGKSLASGHIPAWNPHVMGGIPFAADPLSGWGYLPVMILFTALPCSVAMRWFIVLQPILGGLGVYSFLRTEGTSRVAATVGGSTLALSVAASAFVLSLPFSATLTWTALLLAAAARLMRARTWPSRLVWLLVTALAWGQLAAAHLSDGGVIGSIALVLYLVAKAVAQVRGREQTGRDIAVLAGLIVLTIPLVNLAFLLPRLSYLPGTTLGQGYVRLQQRLAQLRGVPNSGIGLSGISPTFPLRFTVPRGVFVGSLAFVLAFIGWRDRRLLHLTAAFSAFGAASFVLGMKWMASHAQRVLGSGALGSFYLHETERFAFGLILAIAVLAGVGVEAWRRPGSWLQRGLAVAPGFVVWAVLAPSLGLHRTLGWLPLVVVLSGFVLLAASVYRPVVLPVIGALVVGELLAVALVPASSLGLVPPRGLDRSKDLRPYLTFQPATYFPASDYFKEGPIARTLGERDHGRYLSIAPSVWSTLGYHIRRTRPFWGLMGAQQSMLFDLEEGQGYNSIQLVRYWEFLRAVDPKYIKYNAAGFTHVEPIALDLLQIHYLIQPIEDDPAMAGEVEVAQQGRWVLYQLPGATERATVVTSWSVAGSPEDALTAVLDPAFRPGERVILESTHGLSPTAPPTTGGPAGGSAVYRATGPQSALVSVEAAAPSIVVVRNVYDRHWRAAVDGRPATVLPADYLVQGIRVPPGRHTITLSYDDPSIGLGILGSAVSVAAVLGVSGILVHRRKRRRRNATGSSDAF